MQPLEPAKPLHPCQSQPVLAVQPAVLLRPHPLPSSAVIWLLSAAPAWVTWKQQVPQQQTPSRKPPAPYQCLALHQLVLIPHVHMPPPLLPLQVQVRQLLEELV